LWESILVLPDYEYGGIVISFQDEDIDDLIKILRKLKKINPEKDV
jgi:hypothetical protein